MATDKQIAANRRNTQKSTGPKTLVGCANPSRNAFRYGLTKPLTDDPCTLLEARQLADAVFGATNDHETRDLHIHFALAHLELPRIRAARNQVLSVMMAALSDGSGPRAIKHLSGFDRHKRLAKQRQKRAIRPLQKGRALLS